MTAEQRGLEMRVQGLRDDLKACELRVTFWRSLAYASVGTALGLAAGAMPLAFGGYATAADMAAHKLEFTSLSRDMSAVRGALDVLIRQTKPDDNGNRLSK